MTTAHSSPPAERALSERTLRTYAADWALFADWCDATDQACLPADPATVLDFLAGCPARIGTQRVRVAAIDHRHAATGYAPPGKSAAVLAALGRPIPGDYELAPDNVDAVENALRMLPSHGWINGLFGRRDRCLLVLSQLAGVPYIHLAALTPGQLTFTDGTVTITASTRRWVLHPRTDAVVCGPCAVIRWVEAVDVLVTKIATSAVADLIDRADPVTADSPHACREVPVLEDETLSSPLVAPIDQWGATPFPHPPLSRYAASRLARELLAGQIVGHRTVRLPGHEHDPETTLNRPALEPAAPYDKAASDRAWTKRRDDLHRLEDVAEVLTDVDRRVAKLQERVNTLLAGEII